MSPVARLAERGKSGILNPAPPRGREKTTIREPANVSDSPCPEFFCNPTQVKEAMISAVIRLPLILCLLLCLPLPARALKIGVLPAADSLALYVAAEEGLFAAGGLEVEIVPFQSALEQAAAVRAGSVQGYFGDIMNVLLLHASGLPQRIIATTSYSAPEARAFGIALAPGSSVASVDGLAGAKVAIGRSTIVDYMLDCMLESRGLGPDSVEHLDIRQIPVRLQMLMAGQVDAAVLPEPLLSLVEGRGARVILDNTALSMPLAVVALVRDAAPEEDVRSFQAALAEAMGRINADPEKYRELMRHKKLLPRGAEAYRMVRFDPAHTPLPVPSDADIEHVAAWMVRTGLLHAIPAAGAVR